MERESCDAVQRLEGLLDARRGAGFVRECHGDMHLGNMVLLDEKVVIFDGIEFSEELRWIDVMNETAFTAMDLEDRGRPDFAQGGVKEAGQLAVALAQVLPLVERAVGGP